MALTMISEAIAHFAHKHDAQTSDGSLIGRNSQIRIGGSRRIERLAIVADGYREKPVAVLGVDLDFRGTTVVYNVSDGFLHGEAQSTCIVFIEMGIGS